MMRYESEFGDLISKDYRYSTKEVARILGLSYGRIYQTITTCHLSEMELCEKRGRDWYFCEEAIEVIEDRIGMIGNPNWIARSKKLKRIAKRRQKGVE